jgi:three-Cys-motif partner protein
MPDLAHYTGREQAYIKHVFLSDYLDGLLYKVASAYSEIVYVDGFAGPWLSADERFSDTSFGIALEKLRRVKARLQASGHPVRVKAVLVERDPAAYSKLASVPARYRDLDVVTIQGDFLTKVPEIISELGRAFSFVFVDPKGWSVDIEKLKPLIIREDCEVVFNFMFDFVNRFAQFDAVADSLDRLFASNDWRESLSNSVDRRDTIIKRFEQTLSECGKYPYCLSTEILKTTSDRTLYALVYATRHPKGVAVFRDTQVRALREQANVRAAVKLESTKAKSGQNEMFSLHEMTSNQTDLFLKRELETAMKQLLDLVTAAPSGVPYGQLATNLMLERTIKPSDLRRSTADLRKKGLLHITPWPARKQVPDDDYVVTGGSRSLLDF